MLDKNKGTANGVSRKSCSFITQRKQFLYNGSYMSWIDTDYKITVH